MLAKDELEKFRNRRVPAWCSSCGRRFMSSALNPRTVCYKLECQPKQEEIAVVQPDWEELEKLPTMTIKAYYGDKDFDVLVDGDYDGEWLSTMKWGILPNGEVYRRFPAREPKVDEGTGEVRGWDWPMMYLKHYVLPLKKGLWVKHRNGNKLDNRSANLEYITPQNSAMERSQPVRQTRSGYRGVTPLSFKPKGGETYISNSRWKVMVGRKLLGTYGSPEEAARAYDTAAKEMWGERAILNFPEEKDA